MSGKENETREILFRGKAKSGWFYGMPSEGEGGLTIIIYTGECWYDCEVAPETVGQYSGLDDENGVKIFAGDIVRAKGLYTKGIVEWADCAFRLYGKPLGDYSTHPLEVLGNIHDNPELLEEEE